jgi:PAS domain S-box-containing protein
MTTIDGKLNREKALRSRAIAQLRGPDAQAQPFIDASAALGVLLDLASSPSTAPNALALLHELQVQQVEVDLQDEELRRSRVELETSLRRHVQVYDYGPVGQFTVDGNARIRELNRTGATLLGFERDVLLGRSLDSYLIPEDVSTLRAMLALVAEGTPTAFADLHLQAAQDGLICCMHASVCPDPEGGRFLIGLMGVSGTRPTPVG